MQPLNKLRGMRFPDEYIVKMFFKEGLQHSPGRVLELGCGSGNNLMLFHEFGWQVIGVDISRDALSDAVHNLAGGPDTVTMLHADLAQGMPALIGEFDAIILPSINYYVPRASFRKLLADCSRLLKQGGCFFCVLARARTGVTDVVVKSSPTGSFWSAWKLARRGFSMSFTERTSWPTSAPPVSVNYMIATY